MRELTEIADKLPKAAIRRTLEKNYDVAEDDAGRPNFTKWREQAAQHPIEETGRALRGMMSWVDRPITETA